MTSVATISQASPQAAVAPASQAEGSAAGKLFGLTLQDSFKAMSHRQSLNAASSDPAASEVKAGKTSIVSATPTKIASDDTSFASGNSFQAEDPLPSQKIGNTNSPLSSETAPAVGTDTARTMAVESTVALAVQSSTASPVEVKSGSATKLGARSDPPSIAKSKTADKREASKPSTKDSATRLTSGSASEPMPNVPAVVTPLDNTYSPAVAFSVPADQNPAAVIKQLPLAIERATPAKLPAASSVSAVVKPSVQRLPKTETLEESSSPAMQAADGTQPVFATHFAIANDASAHTDREISSGAEAVTSVKSSAHALELMDAAPAASDTALAPLQPARNLDITIGPAHAPTHLHAEMSATGEVHLTATTATEVAHSALHAELPQMKEFLASAHVSVSSLHVQMHGEVTATTSVGSATVPLDRESSHASSGFVNEGGSTSTGSQAEHGGGSDTGNQDSDAQARRRLANLTLLTGASAFSPDTPTNLGWINLHA